MNKTAQMILPLCGALSTRSFSTEENFVDAYLSPSHKEVVVEVLRVPIEATFYPGYRRHWTVDNRSFIELHIEENFIFDVVKFKQGKYRSFTDEAKTRIQQAIKYVYHNEKKSTSQQEKEISLQVTFSRHAVCHVLHNGVNNVLIFSPVLSVVGPSHHNGVVAFRKKLESNIGMKLSENSELMSSPDLSKEVIKDCYYLDVNQVREVSKRKNTFKIDNQ